MLNQMIEAALQIHVTSNQRNNANAAILMMKDSVRNCLISCCLVAPATFLTPTSFARSIDFAVA